MKRSLDIILRIKPEPVRAMDSVLLGREINVRNACREGKSSLHLLMSETWPFPTQKNPLRHILSCATKELQMKTMKNRGFLLRSMSLFFGRFL